MNRRRSLTIYVQQATRRTHRSYGRSPDRILRVNKILTWPCVHRAQSSLMLVWNFCYGLSVGPVCFVILCEVSATKVRSKTIAVATATQALVGIVMTIAIP